MDVQNILPTSRDAQRGKHTVSSFSPPDIFSRKVITALDGIGLVNTDLKIISAR